MQVEAARYENVALVKYITGLKNVPTNHPQTRTGYLALVEAAKSGNMDGARVGGCCEVFACGLPLFACLPPALLAKGHLISLVFFISTV